MCLKLGTATSAAMVPIEINKMGGHTSASVVMKMEKGFLRKPDAIEIINEQRAKKGLTKKVHTSLAEQKKALMDYIKVKTDRVMRVAQASAMAINSMGTGAMLSFFFGFLMFFIPHQLGWITEDVMEISSTLFNSPTEALTMNAQTLTANYAGSSKWPKLTSTDAKKNEAMMQLIFEKATQQLQAQNTERTVQITYGEVHAVYRPLLVFSSPLGEWIQNTMNCVFHFLHFSEDLTKKVDPTTLLIECKFICLY